jgi:predicted dehydrogenase
MKTEIDMQRVRLGVIGCGAISPAYVENFQTHFRSIVDVIACADLVPEAGQKLAARFGIPKVCGVEQLLADPEIEIVLNLTNAWAHFEVSMAVLRSGKHLFTEKPLAVERYQGVEIVELARRQGLLVAGAPDIFLGAGLQTCRRLLDEGAVGTPILANALIGLRYRDEKWLRRGVGPMFDMGVYYLTALVALLGPVKRVTGATSTPFPEKPHPEGSPEQGRMFRVGTPTNVCGLLDFASGCVGVIAALGEAGEGYVPRLEFYGEQATLQANDPNMYCRPARLRGAGSLELTFEKGFTVEGRGLGVAEMAWALRAGREPRAGGELMLHVLDMMHAVHEASDGGRHIYLESACTRPEPFDLDEMLAAFKN